MTSPHHESTFRTLLKECLSVLFMVLSVPNLLWSAEVRHLSFKEAVRLGLKNSREINSAERDLRVAQLSSQSAFAGFLPKVEFDSTHGVKDQKPRLIGQKSPWASDFRLGLNQSIYDNGQTWSQNNAAQLKAQLAELNLARKREERTRDLGLKYLDYILAAKKFELQKEQNKIIHDQYDSIARNYRMGFKPRNDFVRIDIQARRSDLALMAAQSAYEYALKDLRDALGMDGSNDAGLSLYEFDAALPVSSPADMASIKPINDDQLFSVRTQRLQKQIDQIEFDAASRKRWPEVALNAGVNWGSQDYLGTGNSVNDNDAARWFALLTVKYTIWDWGIRRNDVLAAAEKKYIAENTYELAIRTQKLEIAQILNQYERARSQTKLMGDLLELEEENHRLVDRDYKNGIAKYLDLMTVLDDLAEAKSSFFMAKYDLEKAIWNHRFHAGGIYEYVARD